VNHISYVGDAETVAQRVSLADEYDLAGIAFWVLGYEDQGLYDRLCSYFSCVPTPAYRNVALGKPATASSRYSSYYSAAKAVDGNLWEGWLAINASKRRLSLSWAMEWVTAAWSMPPFM
jgi:hypothetical protein